MTSVRASNSGVSWFAQCSARPSHSALREPCLPRIVATHGNGFRWFEPFSRLSNLPSVATARLHKRSTPEACKPRRNRALRRRKVTAAERVVLLSHDELVPSFCDERAQALHLCTVGWLGGRWDGATRRGLACVSDQIFEAAGDGDEEHAAAVVSDRVAVRDVARAEDVVAGVCLDRVAADLESDVALEDPEGFVVAAMDVQRHLEPGRRGDLDDRQLAGGVVRRCLDHGEVAEKPVRLALVAADGDRLEALGGCCCVCHCSSLWVAWSSERSAIAYRQARSSWRATL